MQIQKLYRDEFLHLLKYSLYVSEAHKIIASVMEEICVEIKVKVDMREKS